MTAASAIMARPMAANRQAAAVTDRYREQALALRRLALAAGQSAYELALIPRAGDGLGDLDARWARFTRSAGQAAAGHQRAHVRLAADYHRAYMAAARTPPPPIPLDPEQYAGRMDDGRPLADGLATGLVAVRLALLRAEPPERALLAGWNQAGRLIGHQVLQAGRSALRDVMAADAGVTGWERVVGDEACGACLALAGGVQPDDALPEVHDNCSCTAEPVAGDTIDAPRPSGEELFDRLTDREQAARFAGRGGEAKAALVRARPDGTRPVPFRALAQRHPQAVRAPIVTERPLVDLKPEAPRRSWDGAKFAGKRDRPKALDVAPERTPAGDYVFYHGTSKEGAARIIKEGRLRPDDFNNVGLATTPGAAQSYAAIKGGEVLRVTVPRATLARHELGREIGGSGRNQFLLKPVKAAGKLESQTPWEGIRVAAAAPAGESAAATASSIAPLAAAPAGPAPAPVTASTFARHFDDFLKSSPNADYLTPYSRPELERMTTYLANGGRTGGAIKVADDGVREAVSLFNNGGPRGAGLAMLDRLAADGATRLDCTGDGLRAIYETRGWKVTKTIPWDDAYAPAGWDYAARGRPNIYVMEKHR